MSDQNNPVREIVNAACQALTMIEQGVCKDIAIKEVCKLYKVKEEEVLIFIDNDSNCEE